MGKKGIFALVIYAGFLLFVTGTGGAIAIPRFSTPTSD
jgi:hypothetical protein